MKTYSTQNIRNVVLLGSTKSGKTTLSEAMLYEGKVIDRRGTVEAKNTVSDNAEIEQLNQRSIYATPLYAEFMDTKFNIIDTPGADDFVGGAVSAFKVCDDIEFGIHELCVKRSSIDRPLVHLLDFCIVRNGILTFYCTSSVNDLAFIKHGFR